MNSANPIVGKIGSFLLAAVLALFIWLTATQDQDPINDQFIQLGVDFKGQPAESIRIQPQSFSVQVRLEGPESSLRQLSPENFEAYADLSQVPFGENTNVPIRVNPPSEDVNVTLIIPEELNVLLEEQVSREIPVELDVRGSTARGFTQGEPLLEPAFITVSGPRSDIEDLDFALVTVFLNNPRETSVGEHRPVFYDAQGRVVSTVDLTLDTQDVEVTIPIEQSAGFAEKLITVNWAGDPAYGHQLLNISVDPPSVLVVGPPEAVNALTSLQTEPIDITGLTESFIQPATLDLPDGVTLDQNQEIFVTIGIEPILSTDTHRREVEVLGLGEGLEAELTPDRVGVVIHGPLPVLDSLVPEDVRVTVDLFDLDSGRYSIEPQVDIPDRGIQLRSIQPSAISVFITKTLTTTLDLTNTLSITGTAESLITGTKPSVGNTPVPESNLTPLNSITWRGHDNIPGKEYQTGSPSQVSVSIKTLLETIQTDLLQILGLIVILSG